MIPVYKGKRKGIVVISGGGAKGLCALGALRKLTEEKIVHNPDILCGTSAGAMICLFLNLGYSSDEIYELLINIDFSTLVTCDFEDIISDVHFGINSPAPFGYIIQKMIEEKGYNSNVTFKELREKTGQILIITGTCVNTVSLQYFSAEITPNTPVLDAVQISIAIPFIFKPYKYDNKIWIDGGCMNNYAIDLFHDKLNDVIGICLDDDIEEHTQFEDVQTYFSQVLKCITKGVNLTKVDFYKKYTIHIKCKCDISANWEMKKKHKVKLFDYGYKTAVNYISNM